MRKKTLCFYNVSTEDKTGERKGKDFLGYNTKLPVIWSAFIKIAPPKGLSTG